MRPCKCSRSNVLIREQDIGFFCGTGCLLIRPGNVVDSKFLTYHLGSPFNKEWIVQHAIGATMPNLNTGILSDIPLRIPPLPEQKAIAHILGSLDDKIELNRKQNATLEEMAQALFQSWFVDFDPVIDKALAAGNEIPEALQAKAARRAALGSRRKALPPDIEALFPDAFVETDEMGFVPEGWEVRELGDYLTIKRGGSPRPIHDFLSNDGLRWLKIADATAENSPFILETREYIKEEGLKKTVFLKKGSLILSNSATPGLPKFLNVDLCIHDGWLYFPKRRHFNDEYLYFLFLRIRASLIAKGNGSVFTNLKTDILRAHNVVVPPIEILRHFQMTAKQLLSKLLGTRLQIETLTNLRDTLLPKLISGELRLKDVEAFVAEDSSGKNKD